MLRDAMIERVGPLRAQFGPYKDTFILLIMGFLVWLNAMLDWLGPVIMRQLYELVLRQGSFDDGGYHIGYIAGDYVEKHEEAAQWVLRASQDGHKIGVLGKIGRCPVRTVPLGLVPERFGQRCVTILYVLRKITGEDHPTILYYIERDDVKAVRVQS
ncbi:hypothetical protein E8E11_003014 [Didymella keratinophila]|nr:hypothetical protein E8E11_003014 [Didymella keratinophila]